MLFYHLWLLIKKSLRYAWRRRSCRCCPKILFELLVPIFCLLLLCLLRWMHTPSSNDNQFTGSNSTKPRKIQISPSSIVPRTESIDVLTETSTGDCPSPGFVIEIRNRTLYKSLRKQCPKSSWKLATNSSMRYGTFLLNQSSTGYVLTYQCQSNNEFFCQNTSAENSAHHASAIQHPSVSLCVANSNSYETREFLTASLALQSLLYPPVEKKSLAIYTWPCSSYATDPLFELASSFVLNFILIFIDGTILFSFSLLIEAILDEKRQGITELLRLISVRPILNSLAWFLRVLAVQLIPSVALICILKISFDGGIFLPYLSVWLIIPSIILWTIQVLSRAVLIGHFFTSHLKASLWSWFVYLISFWLAISSIVRLPMVIRLIISAWLPFYSIKRVFILLLRINTDLGRQTNLIFELVYIWFSMIIGSLIMWLLAYYLEQVRPGKYGIPRPWLWPIDYLCSNRIRSSKRRQSIEMNMVETSPGDNITVRVTNLTKTYGKSHTDRQVAVDKISFTLDKSKIHGLIGHNGAGKTTTMEIMCGLLSCDCGSIEIHDKELHENLYELQTSIGYCPQQDMLFSHLTVREQLEFYACVRSHGKKVDPEQIDQLLTMMDMKNVSQRLCHRLSGGMQRKLSILCAFVGDANVILLDEPSSSLDPVARRVLWSWLRENRTDRTLLISSHLLDEVEELCDSVIILDSGKICAQGTVLELKHQFGPVGDRLHLDSIPSYVPRPWIIDEKRPTIQVPNRKELILLLERLERDEIKYSLDNVTLDDVFIKVTGTSDSALSDEANVHSQIDTLFQTRTTTKTDRLWIQQILAVLIRRGQVFLRRARLLPIVILLYIAYAMAPLYMPSLSLVSQAQIQYIVSSNSPAWIDLLPLKTMKIQEALSFETKEDFQSFLSGLSTWQSDYHSYRKQVGLRMTSANRLECFVPSPVLPNSIEACLPILSALSNTTSLKFQFISKKQNNLALEVSALNMLKQSPLYYCFYTLPPTLHLSITLLSSILIICAALTIQDYSSGLHSYSLIHGLRSPIHWLITFLSDLVLCLIWLSILILLARFVHSSTFDGRFFALTPLFFIVNLPFIYLLSKLFRAPILGATIIFFLLQFAHLLNTVKVLFELFRGYRTLSFVVRILRWVLLLLFPNVNVFTLIVAIVRPYACGMNDAVLDTESEFAHERYKHKVLIHSVILIGQFLVYSLLLVVFDIYHLPTLGRTIKGHVNDQEEDDDVAKERHRIEMMTDEEKQREALIIDNLYKRYSGSKIPAVNRLTFAVAHRQCFGLLGFNGSGKTTTFRMLVGDLRPTGGHVQRNHAEPLGYCPQDDISFSALTVLQSIDYICRLHGINPSSLNQLILRQFQLEKYRNRLVSHLSGGTRRRLHLALCLIGSPTLLVLDEPTAKVDPLLRAHIRLILQHRPIDTSIVFASHSMLECEQLCDRLTILVHGNARCLGSPRHLKERYGTDYRIRLTARQPLPENALLKCIDNTNEYAYPKSILSGLFKYLEDLVQQGKIERNYTVQLTSLEHIFLAFQHPPDMNK